MIYCKDCLHGKYYDEIKDYDCNLAAKDLTKCPNLKEMADEFIKSEFVDSLVRQAVNDVMKEEK